MTVSKTMIHGKGPIHLFQLAVGTTVAIAAIGAMLRLSNIWTVTDARYAEYIVILSWGLLLVFGALRRDKVED